MSLRDNPRISPGTRQRIHGIARNPGYRFDPCLPALVAHRKGRKDPQSSPCIAWIHGSSDGLHTDLDLEFSKGSSCPAVGWTARAFRRGSSRMDRPLLTDAGTTVP
jgi:hypothetical protein